MGERKDLNERGNIAGEFSQGVGGWAEYTVTMSPVTDTVRHDVKVPPRKVIPIIFLPGIMGSNLRLSKRRQDELENEDNRSWRPDDMLSINGQRGVLFGSGFGGWFKNATPAQRQLMLDPNETELEYYHYTENKERFDPEGKETLAADARHQNVPDDLEPIPPLMGRRSLVGRGAGIERNLPRQASAAQIARWRGWSEVLFDGAYGKVLRATEAYMNNILVAGELNRDWHRVLEDPTTFGGKNCTPLTKDGLQRIAACWYPVHALGYNFLKSNGESAKAIAERIRAMVDAYRKRGFACHEVIIVTHSMGGLVGRALLHPSYGNLLNDPNVSVLGMYHSAMPAAGAAASYKRMRFGFQDKEGSLEEIKASIVGIDGKHATAILANAPAPLELLPGLVYGKEWLTVTDASGKRLYSWPNDRTALDSIYLESSEKWWRLLNPDWVNPARVAAISGGGLEPTCKRISAAFNFLNSLKASFHPTQSYVSYCSSKQRSSYGEVCFKALDIDQSKAGFPLPPPTTWRLLAEDGRGTLTVIARDRLLKLVLQPGKEEGDETVPSGRSASKVSGRVFEHGSQFEGAYEHQNSFANKNVLTSLLYSLAQIAATADWTRK